jgi:MFS family permease
MEGGRTSPSMKMESSQSQPNLTAVKPITKWLSNASGFEFSLYTALSAFGLYLCVFALRKTYNVALYEGYEFAGVSYKVWMVLSQVIGYMLSKFIGIKVVSELKSTSRAQGILLMSVIASLSWLLFAIIPMPYNLICLFLNGLPLGMVWGMVFGYLEGRKYTEVLGAALSVSFIFSAGFSKTVGSYIMTSWGVSEFWMPFVACCVFFGPLFLFLKMLDQVPPPNAEDEKLRTKRRPMTGEERVHFTKTFLPGLVLLVLTYMLLTAFREFRDNFSSNIWEALGYGDKPGIFTQTETPVTLSLLVLIGSLMLIKNNVKAMIVNHLIVLAGFIIVGLSTLAYTNQLIGDITWMTAVGMGLYFGYIQFNSIFFDRLIAAFKYVSTVGFLIYLADSFGYVGSVMVMLYKEFGQKNVSWLNFFVMGGYIMSIAGSILIILSLVYFVSKHKAIAGASGSSDPRLK